MLLEKRRRGMKVRNKLYEAGIFGMWMENNIFVFQNRMTKERLALSKEEVIELGEKLIEWAKSESKG
jgi:hypothetical protein